MSAASTLAALAVLLAAAIWITLRGITTSDVPRMPVRCRRRIVWLQHNARWLYACCAAAAVLGAAASLSQL